MNAHDARIQFQRGQLGGEQLLDVLEKQEQTIRRLTAGVDRLKQRLSQYEPEIQNEGKRRRPPGGDGTRYSVEAEEKRRRGRKRKKKSPGRRRTRLKFAEAQTFENVYPDHARPKDCKVVCERAVWRLKDGRAVLVGYRVFQGPDGVEPRIPGIPESEPISGSWTNCCNCITTRNAPPQINAWAPRDARGESRSFTIV